MIEETEELLDRFAAGRLSRREAALSLLALALPSLAAARPLAPEPAAPLFRATGLNHLGLRVTDVERSRDFYRRRLGLTVIRDGSPGNCFLRSGSHYLGLFRSRAPGMDHFCYTVEGFDPDDAVARLRSAGLEPRREEDRVYFDDPDGLEVQLDSRFGSWPGPAPVDLD